VIVVDTNVFVALSDRRDAHHAECRDWLAGRDEPLIVPPTVLAEVCYMIDKYLGAESEAKFLDSVGIGPSYRFPARVCSAVRPNSGHLSVGRELARSRVPVQIR
jgi:predicted nucleic acid-binding protein